MSLSASADSQGTPHVVCDVGGTKTVMAVADTRGAIGTVVRLEMANFSAISEVLSAGLSALQISPTLNKRLSLAVAGPVSNGSAKLTALGWQIDAKELGSTLNGEVRLMNDFFAQAAATEHYVSRDLLPIGSNAKEAICSAAPRAVMGAGTGLGEAIVVPLKNGAKQVHILPTEGGHADFAPIGELQIAILRELQKRNEHVSVERVLSGPGLVAIYDALSAIENVAPHPEVLAARNVGDPAAKISELADAGIDALAARTLDLFVDVYGQEAGNFALRTLAMGGLFLSGGIAPKIAPRLQDGRFLRAFLSKGRMADLLSHVPIWIVAHPYPGLVGAWAVAQGELQ